MKKTLLIAFASVILLTACNAKPTVEEESTTNESQEGQAQQVESTPQNNEKANTQKELEHVQEGSVLTNDEIEMTIRKIELSYDVSPENPANYYSHYPAEPGKVFLHVYADVKNLMKQQLPSEDVFKLTVTYDDGYEYHSFTTVDKSTNRDDFTYTSLVSLTPLETMGIHALVEMPEEVETSDKPLSFVIELRNGEKYTHQLR